MKKAKRYIISAGVTAAAAIGLFYFTLPAINPRDAGFWSFLVSVLVLFFVSAFFSGIPGFLKINVKKIRTVKGIELDPNQKSFKTLKRIVLIVIGFILLLIAVIFFTSSPVMHSKAYRNMVTVENSEFDKDIAELPFSRIPVLDRDSAARMGSRTLGEVVELVSQFNAAENYTQINYAQRPVRVTPLEYSDFFKWFVNQNEGIPYYLMIDMVTQEPKLVKLDKGIRYSPSERFQRNLRRHVRFKYPTKMFEEFSFEIDENGHPFWVVSVYDYTIGLLGGRDITGTILVDAVTGDTDYFKISDVPSWVDRAYPAEMIVEQAHFWGLYTNGFWNSIIGQKGVVTTTEGYNYIAIDDDVWLYTGITSVVTDESNIGFLMVNLRTKQTKLYSVNGAEEYSAMGSAQGKVQEKRYVATFPILVNLADRPTYFMSLKDNAGLVKSFAFVDVANYHIVSVADTLEAARNEHIRLLGAEGQDEESGEQVFGSVSGIIEKISPAVIEGNTYYYIRLSGNNAVYRAGISVSPHLPLLEAGADTEISYIETPEDGSGSSTVIYEVVEIILIPH